MRAVAKVAPEAGGIEVRCVPEPEASTGEVKIRVAAAGICGTDMQIYDWASRMARRMVLPPIMGHEVCGTVVALEDALQGFEAIRVGQALEPLLVPDAAAVGTAR